jgi:hypothetical protein
MIAAAAITPTSAPEGPLLGKPYGMNGSNFAASK